MILGGLKSKLAHKGYGLTASSTCFLHEKRKLVQGVEYILSSTIGTVPQSLFKKG
jgi:hypothetical protein